MALCAAPAKAVVQLLVICIFAMEYDKIMPGEVRKGLYFYARPKKYSQHRHYCAR